MFNTIFLKTFKVPIRSVFPGPVTNDTNNKYLALVAVQFCQVELAN